MKKKTKKKLANYSEIRLSELDVSKQNLSIDPISENGSSHFLYFYTFLFRLYNFDLHVNCNTTQM